MPLQDRPFYSLRRLLTGLTIVARMACHPAVSIAINPAEIPANANIHQEISIR